MEAFADMTELASFRPSDPWELVEASLSCRGCLSANVTWSLDVDAFEPRAVCECHACGMRRAVDLSPDQAVRLSLAA
jgi:hypothetical protein